MKNSALSPKRLAFKSIQKSPPSAFINSLSTNQGSIHKSSAFEEPTQNKKQSAISVLREELQNIKSEVARLIDDVPSPTSNVKNMESQKREERAFGKKQTRNKQSNLPTSPRFARRKPNSPVQNIAKPCDDLGKLKTQIEKVKLELNKAIERESKIKTENIELLEKNKILKKINQKLEKEVKLLTMEIQQIDDQRKNEQQAYMRTKKQCAIKEEQVCKLRQERESFCAIIEKIGGKQAIFEKEKQKLNGVISEKERQILKLSTLLDQERKKPLSPRHFTEEKKYQKQPENTVKIRKVTGCQTEGNVEDKMSKEINNLKSQLKNRQKTMQLMFNDIRGMERDLKIVNNLHWEIGEQKKLIEEINGELMRKQAQLVNSKIKGHYHIY